MPKNLLISFLNKSWISGVTTFVIVCLAGLVALGCKTKIRSDDVDENPPRSSETVNFDSIPQGIEIFRNSYGNPILKIDYQINYIDTFQFQYMVKYFSSGGELVRIEAVENDSTNIVLLSERGSLIDDVNLGNLLVSEYCSSCHKMLSYGLAPALKSLDVSEAALTQSLKKSHHRLVDSKLIWESKSSLDFIPQAHVRAITKYINEGIL